MTIRLRRISDGKTETWSRARPLPVTTTTTTTGLTWCGSGGVCSAGRWRGRRGNRGGRCAVTTVTAVMAADDGRGQWLPKRKTSWPAPYLSSTTAAILAPVRCAAVSSRTDRAAPVRQRSPLQRDRSHSYRVCSSRFGIVGIARSSVHDRDAILPH